ncbi:MAG TPA: alpha-glucan family phosphorylase [Nanoarchaeota archaeon]|nr:alpha-glucan family phosphorylase [Nanoarchaeota archaeon]
MQKEKIIFVSNEILIDEIPAYAGGLGILSGGIFSSARDINYPMIGVTFVYRKGYVKHKIENNEIKFLPDEYNPEEYFRKINKKFFIELKNLRIWFTVWEYKLSDEVKILFIDSNVPENPEPLRKLTDRLYIESSEEEKILKRLLLGLGTLELVEALGIKPKKFHLNESHCAFLAIELFKKLKNIDLLRKKLVFTTHTVLPHGHEKFDYALVERYYEIPKEIKILSPFMLNMSKILFNLAGFVNCVSWKHKEVMKSFGNEVFSNLEKIEVITNGVHTKWVAEPLRALYDKYIPGWFKNPEKFVYAGNINIKELAEAKQKAKKELISLINAEGYVNKDFNENYITLVLRRRITGYKRNDILFKDIEKIERLSKKYKLQVIVSGVCHPYDKEGKRILEYLKDVMSVLYYTKLALLLRNGKKYERACVSGGDLFIHTPIPPYEACGTSWMRAGINALPTLATRDGGVVECIIDNYNGWLFGKNRINVNEAYEDLYEFYLKLEKILELITQKNKEYLRICINALKTIGSLFNTHRMLKEYISKAYER